MTTASIPSVPGLPVVVEHLTKNFGSVRAVDDLSFAITPGRVTGFLGPNGAGKTTTLRMLLGLVVPSAGTAMIGGRQYSELSQPMQVVGASLEATGFHPGRTARDHLRVLTPPTGVPDSRVNEVLDLVGLSSAAKRRVGGFSLGMRQRLSLAATLLGDPGVLLLDEPANGLDPEGISWMRSLLRYLASEGRTILISSHILTEVEQTVDDVIIISKGRLVHESSLEQLKAMSKPHVLVSSPDPARLESTLRSQGWSVAQVPVNNHAQGFAVADATAAQVGAVAFASGIELHELTTQRIDLESIFLSMVNNATPEGQSPSTFIPNGGTL